MISTRPATGPAEEQAIADLQWLGLLGMAVIRQSERRGLYHSVLSALRGQGSLYPCHCSRRMLADVSPHGAWPRTRDLLWWHRIGRPQRAFAELAVGVLAVRWIGLNTAR